jgi:hypothetical protein
MQKQVAVWYNSFIQIILVILQNQFSTILRNTEHFQTIMKHVYDNLCLTLKSERKFKSYTFQLLSLTYNLCLETINELLCGMFRI